MARVLEAAGLQHEARNIDEMPHGYSLIEALPAARESIEHILAFLRKVL